MSTPPPHRASAFSRPASALVWINLALLAALTAAFCFHLFPEWWRNPDLSHGLFMPVVVFILGAEAVTRTGGWQPRPGPGTWAVFLGLALLGVLGLAAGGLYAGALEWTHPFVYFVLAAAFVALSAAAAVVFASRPVHLFRINWPVLVLLALWLLSVPLPPGTMARLTLHLQFWVSENVLAALHWLGVPATLQGNVIFLGTTSVGVEEACSGVRSLVSCVFAGLFFSATLVQRPWARVLLVALAAPLALGMNFLRSLTLTLLASRGVDIGGRWHDLTGYAVLGVTAAVLGALALVLGRAPARIATPAPSTTRPPPAAPRESRPLLWTLLGAQLLAVVLIAAFMTGSRPATHSAGPAPDLAAILPAAADGFSVRTESDLDRYSSILRTHAMEQRTYLRPLADGTLQITVYLAWWAPGQAPVSLVASHTPDLCWPGSGWESLDSARVPLTLPGHDVIETEYRRFRSGNYPQNVWFWHLYDGQPLAYAPPSTPRELLALALHYRFRSGGNQMFVRISSNQPWATVAREPLVAEIFRRLAPFGL